MKSRCGIGLKRHISMRKLTVCATALLRKRNACVTNCSFVGFCVAAGLLPVQPKAGRDRALPLQRSPSNFAWDNRRTKQCAINRAPASRKMLHEGATVELQIIMNHPHLINGIALMLSTRCELGKLYQISVQKSKTFPYLQRQ